VKRIHNLCRVVYFPYSVFSVRLCGSRCPCRLLLLYPRDVTVIINNMFSLYYPTLGKFIMSPQEKRHDVMARIRTFDLTIKRPTLYHLSYPAGQVGSHLLPLSCAENSWTCTVVTFCCPVFRTACVSESPLLRYIKEAAVFSDRHVTCDNDVDDNRL
jgi:hypothetical protein